MRELISDLESDAILLERFARLRDEAASGGWSNARAGGPEGVPARAPLRARRAGRLPGDVPRAGGKAGKIGWGLSVHAWLHSVAIRLALHARVRSRAGEDPGAAARRRPQRGGQHPSGDPHEEIERRELRRVLDEALGQLPEKYRAPVVLCYLEGKTNDEAARELGWPAGSMSRRLEQGALSPEASTGAYGTDPLALAGAAMSLPHWRAPDRHPDNLRPPRSGRSIEVDGPSRTRDRCRRHPRAARPRRRRFAGPRTNRGPGA